MKRLLGRLAICGFVYLACSANTSCSQTAKNIENNITAAVTATDLVIQANQNTFHSICAAGQATHDKIIASQAAGTINLSSANMAKEQQVHDTGLAICANLPTNLAGLLLDIPLIQNYVKALSAFLPTA